MSTRLPPSAPKSRIITSLAKMALRPVIMVMTLGGFAWGLAFGITSFEDVGFDRSFSGASSLVTFDIIIGALFLAFTAMMVMGFVTGFLQRPSLARIYSFISIMAGLSLIAGSLFIVIAHFRFQSTIISECTQATTNLTVVYGNPFWFGYTAHNLSSQDASDLCNSSFNRASFTTIIWLLASLVASALFIAVAMAWSYQISDPAFGRQRTDQIRMGAFQPNGQPRYDPPLEPYSSRVPYEDRADAFVPPYDANMPPKYVGEGVSAPTEKQGLYGTNDEWNASDSELNKAGAPDERV